ncbi:hypothetical protein RNO89_16835 [Escherichia coli]|uniref:hypothetical protein n=1 Tax=Escherichia coli TaxID=562 RepID=UPI0013FCF824|nr:hypothetical protein [Escherichia coli]MDW5601763.1 hypothetical protein [Escherichia coli]MDW5644642.1 hypothetical protein [Escherichia coli]MDW5702881.1 hypothetical protein [Escherichia coli]MDW7097346.1 hypothetical protein [Escherichia coli]QNT12539.1 hypothetical protein G6P91_25685 [Escherichia coli]
MIPELIISGEDAKGEFLMSVPRKMLLCSFCVMTMKQDRQIRRLKIFRSRLVAAIKRTSV